MTRTAVLPGTNRTWAQHMGDVLLECSTAFAVSINKTQLPSYSLLFTPDQLSFDQVDAKGPLNGLLSVHKEHPEKDLLLIACDMIQLNQTTINHLITIYQENWGFDCYAYEQDGFIEPLCAIYTSKALDKIMSKLNLNELTSFSLHKLISASNYKSIPATDKKAFSNYNTKDLA